MTIEICFWLAAALALRQQPACSVAALAAALLAAGGVPFAGQLAAAGLLAFAGLLIAHAIRREPPRVRVSHTISERIFEIGTVREVTDSGAKRLCVVEAGGRVERGVAACYEPIRAGDAVRLIGRTDEGVLVQLLARR